MPEYRPDHVRDLLSRICDLLSRFYRLVLVNFVAVLVIGCAGTNEGIIQNGAKLSVAKADPRLVELAGKAVEESRYGDARKILERILIFESKNEEARLLMAEVTLAIGDPKEAVRQFETLTEKSALKARALQGWGLALMRAGKRKKAHEPLKKAVELDKNLWRSWNALAYLYDLSGEWNKSSFAYDQAIRIKPDVALIYSNRGFSRLLQKKADLAIEDLRTAIRLEPKLEVARRNLLFALAWKGQYQRAMLGVEKGKRGEALNNIGFIALLREDFAAAEAHFLRALEADAAYNATAYKNLSYIQALKKVQNREPERANN